MHKYTCTPAMDVVTPTKPCEAHTTTACHAVQ